MKKSPFQVHLEQEAAKKRRLDEALKEELAVTAAAFDAPAGGTSSVFVYGGVVAPGSRPSEPTLVDAAPRRYELLGTNAREKPVVAPEQLPPAGVEKAPRPRAIDAVLEELQRCE